jgi:hypothetical protein
VCFLLGLLSEAGAAITWPDDSDWVALESGGSNMTDPDGPNPDTTDIRGDSTYSSAFWLPADGLLHFRIRLDDVPSNKTQAVWQVLFDTDSDTGIDWVLQLDAKSDYQVSFVRTTTEGSTFGDVVLGTSTTGTDPDVKWTAAKADYSRFTTAGDGSSFSGDDDGFVDLALPWGIFTNVTGIGVDDPFRVGISSSTTHTQTNKDLPFDLDDSSSVDDGFGDSISFPASAVPEPGTMLLFGLGLLALGERVRRRRRTRRGPAA